MPTYGYKLMTEEHGPHDLLQNAIRAEEVGFDFAAISDHFHPWTHAQGHAPFAWSVLGAIAARTERLRLATAVTCPTIRYHPAVIAQAAATLGVLSKGRFTLGLGAGENLNEHVVGKQLPGPQERQAMLKDAVEIIQRLFTGDDVTYQGEHLSVERAKLFDRPDQPVPLAIAAGGPKAAELAGEAGAGLFSTEPSDELVEAYKKGGGKGARYAEVPMCFAKSEQEAERIAVERFAFSALGWKVNAELPTPASFEAATKFVRGEDLAENISLGPDPEKHVQAVKKYVKAGYDHIVLIGIGPDQAGFLGFFREELAPRLRKL
jgi:G6PDH family F420-dependent oxidoreductase